MKLEPIQPPGWAAPKGYSNGVLAPAGARLLAVAGQIAWDAEQRLVGRGDFALQFRTALANVVAVVRAAGGQTVSSSPPSTMTSASMRRASRRPRLLMRG